MQIIGYACKHPDPPLQQTFLALSELTVLLGPNDAGKSSLLHAIDRDLAGGHFADADEDRVKRIGGVFYADVTDNELWAIATTAALTRTEHLNDAGRASRGRRPPWDDGLWRPPKYDGLHPGDPAQLIEHLRGEGSGRELVLDALSDSTLVAIECAGLNEMGQRVWNAYWCLARMADLKPVVREALEASDLPYIAKKSRGRSAYNLGLYSATHGNTSHLRVDGAPMPIVALGPCVDLPMPTALATPADFGMIREAVQAGITTLVNATCHTHDATLDGDALPAHERAEREAPQAWLTRGEKHSLYVREEASAAARFLSATTNRLLPDFVSNDYQVQIELRDLDMWFDHPPFDICLRQRNRAVRDVDFPVERCADGHQLWLQLALLDALEHIGLVTREVWSSASDVFEIERERQNIASDDDTGVSEWEEQHEALVEELQSLLIDFRRSEYSDGWPRGVLGARLKQPHSDDWTRGGRRDRRFFLVDEPERHLHPRLQRAAATWLASTAAERQAPCLLATHSAPFLALAGDSASYVLVTRNASGGANLQPIDPVDLEQLDEIATTMGFDRGDLLTLVNVWLIVEGETDKVVLDTLFARELREAGIEVVPLHGTAKWKAVLDADALWRFTTAQVAVMFDKLPAERVIEMRGMSCAELETLARSSKEPEEIRDMARLLQAANRHQKTVEPIANSLPDMLCHLDEDAVREVFLHYPGHAKAEQAWQRHHKGSRDAFLKRSYGITKTPEAFSRMARAMAERGLKPSGLVAIVSGAATCVSGSANSLETAVPAGDVHRSQRDSLAEGGEIL